GPIRGCEHARLECARTSPVAASIADAGTGVPALPKALARGPFVRSGPDSGAPARPRCEFQQLPRALLPALCPCMLLRPRPQAVEQIRHVVSCLQRPAG